MIASPRTLERLAADKETRETAKRQTALAKAIGVEFCNTDRLVPAGRHSSFYTPPLPIHENLLDARICDVPWWVVGHAIAAAAPDAHVIDHAWLLVFGDKIAEPWGLVTEPYLNFDKAERIALLAAHAMTYWGISVHALEPARSAWNPGACVPITVVLAGDFHFRDFIRHTLPIALGWCVPELAP